MSCLRFVVPEEFKTARIIKEDETQCSGSEPIAADAQALVRLCDHVHLAFSRDQACYVIANAEECRLLLRTQEPDKSQSLWSDPDVEPNTSNNVAHPMQPKSLCTDDRLLQMAIRFFMRVISMKRLEYEFSLPRN